MHDTPIPYLEFKKKKNFSDLKRTKKKKKTS